MKNFAPQLARSRASAHEPRKERVLPSVIAARDLHKVLQGSYRMHENRVAATVQWCEFHRLPVIEIYTGPRVVPRAGGGYDLRPNDANVGISDVLTVVPVVGRMVLLEVKTGKARRSPAQRALHQRFVSAGAMSIDVRDVARDLEALAVEVKRMEAIYQRELARITEASS